ncbi:hypothetical protein ZWY2020_032172 [Hordeum vulgare]|nr:hypothetical protein ZWY2020_032172 [Hordeum vulgare]
MHWKPHKHIDKYMKDIVKQLRQNNVSLGKVYSIIGRLFGVAENVLFTKRSLKNLCRKMNKEQSDGDATKTMEIFAEMKANDPEFNYAGQGGVVLKLNIPLERHASKLYTRAMFEQFGDALYISWSYVIEELEPAKVYLLTHRDAAAREKWSKVNYKVIVHEEKCFFECECGSFEHVGMICCHALKVMVHLDIAELPEKHVVKRWTRNARDVLPENLQRYKKDNGPPKHTTYRHTKMYFKALECVQLGDSNVKCYEVFMAMMSQVRETLQPLSLVKDGMGLAEREAAHAAECELGLVAEEPVVVDIPDLNEDINGEPTRSSCFGEPSRKR